jgi:hypothetical protein
MSAILHNYSMEYCKRSRISSFECAILTPSALYLTCECALIGTPLIYTRSAGRYVPNTVQLCLSCVSSSWLYIRREVEASEPHAEQCVTTSQIFLGLALMLSSLSRLKVEIQARSETK